MFYTLVIIDFNLEIKLFLVNEIVIVVSSVKLLLFVIWFLINLERVVDIR